MMTAATQTPKPQPKPRRRRAAKPPVEKAEIQQAVKETVEQKQAQRLAEASALDVSNIETHEGGAHADGELELDRIEKELGGFDDDIEKPQANDEPQSAGWAAIQSAGLLHMAFAAVAAGRGAHWVLEEKEAEMMGGSLDVVLDKYFPDGPGEYTPEIALFASVVMIVAPRLAKDVSVKKEAYEKENAENEAFEQGLHEVQ